MLKFPEFSPHAESTLRDFMDKNIRESVQDPQFKERLVTCDYIGSTGYQISVNIDEPNCGMWTLQQAMKFYCTEIMESQAQETLKNLGIPHKTWLFRFKSMVPTVSKPGMLDLVLTFDWYLILK